MKYYCKTCGAIFYDEQANKRFVHTDIECIRCSSIMKHYPDYEMPEQYEKRTGEAYSKEGLVWVTSSPETKGWCYETLGEARQWHKEFPKQIIVIADPPVPPPDGWRPEDWK